MYEQMRNDFMMALPRMTGLSVSDALRALDQISVNYEVSKKFVQVEDGFSGLPEIAKTYLMQKTMAGLSEGTLENYRSILTVFFRTVLKQPEEVTANDIRIWLFDYQKDHGVTSRTLDKYREYISRFFAWAHAEGYIQINPARSIEAIKYEEKPRESLTQIELEYLRMACETPRELAIIETLYSTGCRVSELAAIKKSDIDWQTKSVHLFGKGKKHRYSFLNAKSEVALKVYLATRDDDCEYLFATIRKPHRKLSKDGIEKIVRVIAKRCSGNVNKKITPHVLRHTTATLALKRGMSIEEISKLLGHENLETTMIYANSSVDDIKAVHAKHVI